MFSNVSLLKGCLNFVSRPSPPTLPNLNKVSAPPRETTYVGWVGVRHRWDDGVLLKESRKFGLGVHTHMGPPHSRGPWPLGFAFLLKSALVKLLAMFPDIMAACLQVAALTPGLPSDLCPWREKQQQLKPVARSDMPGARP